MIDAGQSLPIRLAEPEYPIPTCSLFTERRDPLPFALLPLEW